MTLERVKANMAAAIERRDTDLFGVGGPPREGVPSLPEDIRVGLIEAGARRRLAELLGRDASADAAAWARAADHAGMSRSEIARHADVPRTTVYAWLDQ